MRSYSKIFGLLISLFALGVFAFAQSGRTPQTKNGGASKASREAQAGQAKSKDADRRDPDGIKLETTLVNVPVIASDHGGAYIADLKRDDLTVFENGVRQEIVFFATVTEPFHVVLMLDTSLSTQEKLEQIKRAASAFVEQLETSDLVKVVSFDDEVRDLCEFTNDRAVLRRAIDRTQTGQSTRLYDAMALALEKLRPIRGRTAIVLLTDGADTHSKVARYEDNMNAVEESGVIVYPILYETQAETEYMLRKRSGSIGHINLDAQYQVARQYMNDIAAKSGGRLHLARKLQSLPDAFAKIAAELRTQYALGYYPSNAPRDGSYRKIKVRTSRKGVAIRARPGYRVARRAV